MTPKVLLYCVLGGMVLILPGLSVGQPFWYGVSGVVLVAALVPVALYGPSGFLGQFGVIFPILFVITALTTWSEALLFMPSAMGASPAFVLISQTVLYLILATVLSVLAKVLKLSRESVRPIAPFPIAKSTYRILLCAVAYVAYYLVFGAITYEFFTKEYYPDAPQIVERLGLGFWVIQLARGLFMALAVLPAVYTLRMSRLGTAVYAGLLIWIAGGLAPLLIPNEFMDPTQRLIHVIEIFSQNFTLGLTAGLLLRHKDRPLANYGANPVRTP